MKVTNRNKSNDKAKHVCDFCGKDVENLWETQEFTGHYCFEHFREMHDDTAAFDEWYKKFKEYINE